MWEVVGVTVLQLVLCGFNVFVTWRSFAGWLRNRAAARAAAAGAAQSQAVESDQSPAALRVAPRQYEVGMAPPTAHIALTSGGGSVWAGVDETAAAKRSAQDAYGQHVQNAARQRKALERAQEAQDSPSFSRVMTGGSAVRVF